MELLNTLSPLIFSVLLIGGSLGVVTVKKPVHACLCFLLCLMTLASYYLKLQAEFISVMQILVYAGAILVIFMFVVVLFQDAFLQIDKIPPQSKKAFLWIAAAAFLAGQLFFARHIKTLGSFSQEAPEGFGTAETMGRALYLDFFFPFEVVIIIFLVAVVGALYIGKKVR